MNKNIKSLNLMNEYAQRADLGNFLVNLESRLEVLEGEEGEGDLSALQQKVSNLEEKVTTLEGAVESLEGVGTKVTTLEGKVTTLEETVSTNGNKLTSVEGVANQNKSDIGTLKERVEALKGAGA